MQHFNILASVIGLFVGAWATIYVHHKSRRFSEPTLRYLFGYMLINNLSILHFLLLRYFNLNLPWKQFCVFLNFLNQITLLILALLLLGKAICLMKAVSSLREKPLPKWFSSAMFSYMSVLVFMTWLAGKIPDSFPVPMTQDFFFEVYYWSLQLLVAFWLLRPLADRSRPADLNRRRVATSFSLIFLINYLIYVLQVFLQSRNLDNWSIVLAKFLTLYTNLLPLFWLKFYYIPWAGTLEKNIGSRVGMSSLQKAYGLSARELEILNLLLDGNSYKQIEDLLFISLHTVRRHGYNLFRKMGVKNLQQLIHSVSTFQQENH